MNKEHIINAAMKTYGISREEAEQAVENVTVAIKKVWNAIKTVMERVAEILNGVKKYDAKQYHAIVKDLRKPSQVALNKPKYSHTLK